MVNISLVCCHCGSEKVVRDGKAANGKQRLRCRECGRRSRESPGSAGYSEEFKAQVLRAYQERTSLRGLQRVFGVSRQTVTKWLKKSEPLATSGADPGTGPSRG
jgi:transposase-like protein